MERTSQCRRRDLRLCHRRRKIVKKKKNVKVKVAVVTPPIVVLSSLMPLLMHEDASVQVDILSEEYQ